MLAIIMGIAVGLILGLTGAGGSVIAVPLLIFGLGWQLTEAVPTALLAVSITATLGTIGAWRSGHVRYRAAITMFSAGLISAPAGLILAQHLPDETLKHVFASILLVVAARMIMHALKEPEETKFVRAAKPISIKEDPNLPVCQVNPETGRIRWTQTCALAILASGLLTGFLSGLLGVGGGFIIVPILRAVSNLKFHAIVATSLMTIALTSAYTVLIAILNGQHLPWEIALPFIAGSILGMWAGRLLSRFIAGPQLQFVFAILIGVISLLLLTK